LGKLVEVVLFNGQHLCCLTGRRISLRSDVIVRQSASLFVKVHYQVFRSLWGTSIFFLNTNLLFCVVNYVVEQISDFIEKTNKTYLSLKTLLFILEEKM
jgi:hypothetical protein